MALTKTIVTPQGFESADAYIICDGIKIYGKNQMGFSVRSAKEKGLLNFSDVPYVCTYSLEGENPFKQAYEYLKTLPEFADAVDC